MTGGGAVPGVPPPPGEGTPVLPPVLPWRLVAGALLHFVLPAYVAVLVLAWVFAGRGADPLGLAAAVSWRFCLAYAALTLAASAGAALADPPLRRIRARRDARDPAAPARISAARVSDALRRLDAIGSAPLAAAVAGVRAARWDHADERCRAIAADLARAAAAFAAADESAPPGERGHVAGLAAASLANIAAAVEELAAERARLDGGDAATHARYIAERYGSSAPDFR